MYTLSFTPNKTSSKKTLLASSVQHCFNYTVSNNVVKSLSHSCY